MSDWRTIETAPKDGTAVAIWCPMQADRHHAGMSAARIAFFSVSGWLSLPGWWRSTPTHWMPLPDPPVAAPVRED